MNVNNIPEYNSLTNLENDIESTSQEDIPILQENYSREEDTSVLQHQPDPTRWTPHHHTCRQEDSIPHQSTQDDPKYREEDDTKKEPAEKTQDQLQLWKKRQ
jgi:hypothetical protein